MEKISQYILSIVLTALICSVIKALVSEASTNGRIISSLCAVFTMITVITPLVNIEIPNIEEIKSGIHAESQSITDYGKELADEEYRSIIKTTTESYILEKASSLNAVIEIDVTLNESDAMPESISIWGDVSPYTKQRLSHYLIETFAISEDQQKWNQIS